MSNESFFAQVYRLVAQIPAGKVATYGQIALWLGRPAAARAVGYAMRRAPQGLPCHRVVNRTGTLAPRHIFPVDQRALLEAEGIGFLPDGRIDLRGYLWTGSCGNPIKKRGIIG